tara:strand:- start:2676 stop:3413 length:738 start_codon:yes stop_codon:yes gene_type:complete
MSNYTRNTLTGDLAPVNAELEKIQQSISDKLDRSPSSGQANQIESTFDANNNKIINIPAPTTDNEAVRKVDLDLVKAEFLASPISAANSASEALASASEASDSAAAASSSSSTASTSSSAAETSAAEALTALENVSFDIPFTSAETIYTFTSAQRGETIRRPSATANTVRIPEDTSPFPINGVLSVVQTGAGPLTIDGEVGVTLNGVLNGSTTLAGYAAGLPVAIVLTKIGANSYELIGSANAVT